MGRSGIVSRVIGVVVLLGLWASAHAQEGKAVPPQEGMFIHVSHGVDDPHRLLMAFKMATVMAESGRGVLVYCDIKAVTVLTREATDISLEPFPSARTQLARMLELGVRVRACPTCMKVAGIKEEELREGVKIADREEFFDFVPGRIISLDY
jgi:predicted peroxiredoxin